MLLWCLVALVVVLLLAVARRPTRYAGYPYVATARASVMRLHAMRSYALDVSERLHPESEEDRAAVMRLKKRLRTAVMVEGHGTLKGATVDKGRRVHLLLKVSGTPVDEAVLRDVMLHEMAHIMSVSEGHTEEHTHYEAMLRDASRPDPVPL